MLNILQSLDMVSFGMIFIFYLPARAVIKSSFLEKVEL